MKRRFLACLLTASIALTGAVTPALANSSHHHGGQHHGYSQVHSGHGHHRQENHRRHDRDHHNRVHHHRHHDDDFGDLATGLLIGGAIGAMVQNSSSAN